MHSCWSKVEKSNWHDPPPPPPHVSPTVLWDRSQGFHQHQQSTQPHLHLLLPKAGVRTVAVRSLPPYSSDSWTSEADSWSSDRTRDSGTFPQLWAEFKDQQTGFHCRFAKPLNQGAVQACDRSRSGNSFDHFPSFHFIPFCVSWSLRGKRCSAVTPIFSVTPTAPHNDKAGLSVEFILSTKTNCTVLHVKHLKTHFDNKKKGFWSF